MTLTAMLFAGGESRRMGRDKATLDFNGEPLWTRQLRTLRQLKASQILISARTEPAWRPPDVATVLDEAPGCGPLGGLAAAASRVKTTHLLALPIDLPLMTAGHLAALWNLARPGCGVVPTTSGGLEPLCAIYPAESLPAARAARASGDLSLRRFIKSLAGHEQVRFHAVTHAEQPLYQNLNTPPEFLEAIQSQAVLFKACP